MSHRLVASLMKQTQQPGAGPQGDAMQLARFVAHRDEAAFTALVHRHAPLVWAVCRNALPCETDAEDAFQATFLALVRHARRVRQPEALGAWLHGAAVRVCLKARRTTVRRRVRESRVAIPAAATTVDAWFDDLTRVHEEIHRLPRREHEVFVLCILEGASRSDAARRLGLKVSSVTGLLTRARQRLQSRLAATGAAPALALTVAASTPAAVPPLLLAQACRCACTSAALSPMILSLSSSALEVSMRKSIVLAVVVTLGLGLTAGRFLAGSADAQSAQTTVAQDQPGKGGTVNTTTTVRDYYERMLQKGYLPSSQRVPPPAAAWEYKVVFRNTNSSTESMLNELGAAGWELCTASPVENFARTMFVFKRPGKATVTADNAPRDARDANPFGRDAKTLTPNTSPARSDNANTLDTYYRHDIDAETQVIPLKHADAHNVAITLNGLFDSSRVIPDARTNSLIIQGPKNDQEKFKRLLEKLDGAEPKQAPGKR